MPRTNAFGARASMGAGLPDLYRLDALLDVGAGARRRPRAGARHAQDPARERAPARRRRHRPRGRTSRRSPPGARAARARPRSRSCRRGSCSRTSRACPRSSTSPRCATRWRTSAATRRRSTRWCPRTSSSTTRCRSTRGAAPGAFAINVEREYERNGERYQLLRWAQTAFRDLRVVPPGTGIIHQVNLEYLATVVTDREDADGRVAYPDTLVGTDSHTTMVNGLGVLGYGVGGIEAEAVLLGQPLYQPMPRIVGVRLTGELPTASTATDLVLVITEMLRSFGVVGAFVEFAGDGLAGLSLADRATISNMSPEFGATATLFPIDDETLVVPAADRPARRSAWTSSSATRRPRACGASPATGPSSTSRSSWTSRRSSRRSPGPRRPQDRVALAALGGELPRRPSRRPRASPPSRSPARERRAAVRARVGGDRGDHVVHEHVEPDGDGRRRAARPQRRRARAARLAHGQDLARARLEGRHRLPREGRPHGAARGARLRARRLRLHDLHRQLAARSPSRSRRRSSPTS